MDLPPFKQELFPCRKLPWKDVAFSIVGRPVASFFCGNREFTFKIGAITSLKETRPISFSARIFILFEPDSVVA